VLALGIYVLVFKIDRILRRTEYETINLISSVNTPTIFINSINEFLRRYIGSTVEDISKTEWNLSGQRKDVGLLTTNSHVEVNRTKTDALSFVSVGENSVRELIP
jgi:hypothetical protein